MRTAFGYKTINGKAYIFAQTTIGYSIIGLDSEGKVLVHTVRYRLILENDTEIEEQRSRRYAVDTYYYDPLNSAQYRNTLTNLPTTNNQLMTQREFKSQREEQMNIDEIEMGISQMREFDFRIVMNRDRFHYEHIHCHDSETIKDRLTSLRPISASECFPETEQLERMIGKEITDILLLHI